MCARERAVDGRRRLSQARNHGVQPALGWVQPHDDERARVLAASKDIAGAERIAQQIVAQTAGRLFRLHLEASLVLGEIQTKGKNAAAGRKRLKQLAATARASHFELIARKASTGSVEFAQNERF